MILINDLRRLHEPYLAELMDAVRNVIDSGWFVLGEQGRAFEALFAASCGRRYGFGVASGTDAIEVALRAVGVVSGDRVATVANAGGYSTAAIFACGATPHYVDVDPDTMNIDLRSVPAALSLRPRALVLTHLYGRLGPVTEVARLCADSGTPLIEDCAQAYSARSNGRAAGAFGALGCYSFYPTKNLGALGDGGAVVTDDDRLAEQIKRIRQYGWSRKYCVAETGGRNSRLDEIQAAVLTVKLPYVAAETGRRRAIAARYLNEIRNSAIAVPHRASDSDAVHLFVVRSPAREALALYLADAGIQTDIHYPIPDHLQPAFAARFAEVVLPVTERLATEVLSLPCHPGMTDREVSHVVGACNAFHA